VFDSRSGADIVPRLSIHSLAPFFTVCRYVDGLTPSQKALLRFGQVDWKFLEEKSRQDRGEYREHERLHVPGVVFHLVRSKTEVSKGGRLPLPGLKSRGTGLELLRVPRVHFQAIKRAKGMFLMHIPSEYRKSLVRALRSLGADTLKRPSDASRLLRSLATFPVTRRPASDAHSSEDRSDIEHFLPSESVQFFL
jgi:hypothetical protein